MRAAGCARVTVRATVPGTVVRTCPASSERPENDVARSSSVSSSGLPAVVSKQASTNAGEASIRVRTSAATPSTDSGDGPQQPRRGRGREPVEQRLLGPRLGRPRGDRQQHGQVLDAPGERVEEAQARRVGPVRVVDDDQQRLLGGEVRAQPIQPVERRVARAVPARGRRAEDRLGQRRRRPRTAARGAPAPRRAARPRTAAARSRTRSRAPAARRSRSARAARPSRRASAGPAATPSCPARRVLPAAPPTRGPRGRRKLCGQPLELGPALEQRVHRPQSVTQP